MSAPQYPWTSPSESIIPSGTLSCLQQVEKRCPVYRAGPSLFVSQLRADLESSSAAVLNCISRDAPRQNLGGLLEALHALEISARIPPYKDCTDEKRIEFLQWLRTVTHLRNVYLFSELHPSRVALLSNSLLSRTIRYIGRSTAAPKRIVILETGVCLIASIPISRFLCETPGAMKLVVQPKENMFGGLFATNITAICPETLAFMKSCDHWLRFGVVVNLAPQDIPALPESSMQTKYWRPGPTCLPLRTPKQAIDFYSQAFTAMVTAILHQENVLLIDTGRRYHSALLTAMALIHIGKLTPEEATRFTQSRLHTLEFDGYSLAALATMASPTLPEKTRLAKAIECLGLRVTAHDENEQAKKTDDLRGGGTPALPLDLLKGVGPVGISDRWEEIEAAGREISRHHFLNAVQMIQTIFNNVLKFPDEAKYRQLRENNPKIAQTLGCKFGVLLLSAGGWVREKGMWRLPMSVRLQELRDVLVYLSNTL